MKIFSKKHRYTNPIVMIIVITIGVFAIHPYVRANTESESLQSTSTIINQILKFASRGWMLLATLAGKLMTNTYVYGEVFGLDRYLFKMRNISKNLANYLIGFLFLYAILQSLFKDDGGALIKKLLPKLLIAGILVQASRWLMGAMLDVATIATATVSSVPSALINLKDTLKKDIVQKGFVLPSKITCNNDGDKYQCNQEMPSGGISNNGNKGFSEIINQFVPKNDSMAGPLMFMGMAILNLQDFTKINEETFSLKNITTELLMQFIIIIAFIVPLIALIVANIMRIFYLWIFIAFSPFFVVLEVFGGDNFLAGIKAPGNFTIGNLFGLAFQPVIAMAGISLALIFLLSVYGILKPSNNEPIKLGQGLTISSKDNSYSSLSAGDFSETEIKGHVIDSSIPNQVGGVIGYLILVIFTIGLLWTILKLSTSTSDITKGATEMVFKTAQGLAMTTRFIPLTGADGQATTMSLGAIKEYTHLKQEKLFNELSGDNKVSTEIDDVSKSVGSFFGNKNTNKYNSSQQEQTAVLHSLENSSTRQNEENFYNSFKKTFFDLKGNIGIKLSDKNNITALKALGKFIANYKINNKPIVSYFFQKPEEARKNLESGNFGSFSAVDFKDNKEVVFANFLENMMLNKNDLNNFKSDHYITDEKYNPSLDINKVFNNIYKKT